MLTLVQDDVLDGPAPVIPVNLVGAMGKGLARAAAERWPLILHDYRRALQNNLLLPPGPHAPEQSRLHIHRTETQTVILAPTKDHWRNPSPPRLVRATIRALAPAARAAGIRTLNIPPIGCGLGGLDPDTVAPWVVAAAHSNPDINWILHRWPDRALTAALLAARPRSRTATPTPQKENEH